MRQYPSTFMIETVLGCNLSCPECAVGGGLVRRKYGMMPFAQFVDIMDKIKDHCKYLYLHLWGEPMLNPDIFKMIEYAGKYTKTNISTNANTLTESSAKMLVRSGVTDLIVSIDGISQECYSMYRKGGNAERALNALKWLAEHANASHKKNGLEKLISKIFPQKNIPNITPQFIMFKHNEHEAQLFSDFCRNLGLKSYFRPPYIRDNSLFENCSDPTYHRSMYSSDISSRKENMKNCKDLTDVMTILLDGSVVCCCYDHNGVTTFGNIFTSSLETIINSSARVKFENQLAAGDPPDFCLKNCFAF